MEQRKEAVYLINDERYLHLRENGAGVGFATYNKVTGEPLESGQISEKNLPPDGRNAIPAARNWYLVGTPYHGNLEYIRANITNCMGSYCMLKENSYLCRKRNLFR